MRILNKLKVQFKRFMTGKSGFSLVELIVVIAIMAVMAAVLAPALIGYVEKSRAQKDYSAMGEVVESATLALSTQSVYDEVLDHSVYDNVSCYVDKNNEAEFSSFKVKLKDAMGSRKEQYMFNDEARKLDETVYFAAGNMRGLTVTLSPSSDENGKRVYVLKNGIINKFVGRKTGYLSENPELYNAIRSVVGDKVVGSSQTYRNSDYTLFIRIGTTGGKQEEKQDAVQVWGQFNGTNLTKTDHEYRLAAGRDVGSDGANDEINNANKNDLQEPSDFGEDPLKTMTIDGVQYKYKASMTWREWFNSEYNTSDWTIKTRVRNFTNGPITFNYITNGKTCPGCSACNTLVQKNIPIVLTYDAFIPAKDINDPETYYNENYPLNIDTQIDRPISNYDLNVYDYDYSEFVSYHFGCEEGGTFGVWGYNLKN